MPDRFPALVAVAAFLFLAGLAVGFVWPLAEEAGRVAYIKELTDRG